MRPGEDLIEKGITDLNSGTVSEESLLVSIASSRLRDAGVDVPTDTNSDAGTRLYLILAEKYDNAAHSRYNALRRRLLSYIRTRECGI